jgi:tetratricopeptide (TPR) repeat protein
MFRLGWSRGGAAGKSAGFAATAEKARRAGDPTRAVEVCREGLEKFPEQLSARVTLGCALLDLDRFDEARVELESVLRRAPDNLAAIRAMAELHDRSENTALLGLEQGSDWPPTQAEIDDAAAAVGVVAPSETPAAFVEGAGIEAVLAESEVLEASAEIVDRIEAAPTAPAEAEEPLVDLGETAADISPLEALEEFLRRAESRRLESSPETTT